MRKLPFIAAALVATLVWQTTSEAGPADELVVVVNPANPVKSVSREDLRPIFQTTKTEWPDGTRAGPVNLADDSPVRQTFDAAVLGLDPDRVARYWVDRKIRGGERPPRKVTAWSAALRAVAGDRGGLAYLPLAEVNGSVKVVARIRNGQVIAP